MEWIGLMSLGLMLCYASICSGKIRRLEHRIANLKKEKGNDSMSKIISELTGKRCKIITFDDMSVITAVISETDEEWVKLKITDKKGNDKIRIIRVDSIKQIEAAE